MPFRGGHDLRHQHRRDERTRPVVDEHDPRPVGIRDRFLERPKPGADRILAPVASIDERRPIARNPAATLEHPPPVGGRDDHDRPDGRGRRQRVDGVREQRPVADHREELVRAAHPRRGAGGDDDRVGGSPRAGPPRRVGHLA